MKHKLSLIMAAILISAAFSAGCSKPQQKEYVSIEENSYITDYTDKITSQYAETEEQGLALYEKLFDLNNKVSVDIFMTKDEIGKLQSDFQKYTENDENRKSEIFRRADVTFTIGSESYTVEDVGIRLKGNQSILPFYDYDGKPNICSYKLSFDETFDDESDYGPDAQKWTNQESKKARKNRTFASLSELDVKWNISYDQTNIREIYAAKLFESADTLVQKIGLSQMKVNGNNYGLVKIYEPVDKKFLKKRLPEEAVGGDLYKCMWSECDNSGNRTGGWRGASYQPDNSYGIQKNSEGIKYNFNLKTNKKSSKHESIKNFLEVINKENLTKDELEKVLDTDYFANFMAAEYFAGDPDDFRNNYNNHYLYFRKDNGKAIFIVYDNDRTLGITYGLNRNCAVMDPYAEIGVMYDSQDNPLIKNTLTHNASSELVYIRDKYTAALKKIYESGILSNDDFNKMYETAKANYQDIITPYMTFANQQEDFKFSLDGVAEGGETANMSFEQFCTQILDTYKKSSP